jgi:hypothetical protein
MSDDDAEPISPSSQQQQQQQNKDGILQLPSQEIDNMAAIREELEEVKNIMHDNIDKVMERGDRLDRLSEQSEDLSAQSKQFYKKANKLRRCHRLVNCPKNTVKCVCEGCADCSSAAIGCVTSSITSCTSYLCGKNLLFDNVLADTENAFQALAKLLHIMASVSLYISNWHLILYVTVGVWFRYICELLAFLVVLISSIVLILPSFFTLLIVRTTTVEKESKAFGGEFKIDFSLYIDIYSYQESG